MDRGLGGHGSSNFFEIVGISEMLMFRRKIFGRFAAGKDKDFKFSQKSLNLDLLRCRYHDASM